MHRVDTSGATQDNKFTDGNPAQGTSATVVDAAILNAIQEEIAYCVEQMEIALEKGNNTQLWAAITALSNFHAQLTNPHGATSAATASRLMLRDAAGRVKVAAAAAGTDVPIASHAHPFSHPALTLRKSTAFVVPAGTGTYYKNKMNVVHADQHGLAALYDSATGKFTPGADYAGMYLINWALETAVGLVANQSYDAHYIIVKNYGGAVDTVSAASVDPYIEEWCQTHGSNGADGYGDIHWKSETSALVYLDADDYITFFGSMVSNGGVPLANLSTTHPNSYGNIIKIARVG